MYDYIIVGAGSAGCAMAHRLSEDAATRVLLLEAGPSDKKTEIHIPAAFAKLFKTEYDWNYTTTPQAGLNGRQLYWPRGRTLGGSSSLNAQMWLRGCAADYDEWSSRGNEGWSHADVLPIFRRIERSSRTSEFRGSDGPLDVSELRDPNPATRAFVRAAVEAGIAQTADHNGACLDGVDYTQVNQRRGSRCSTSVAYLRPALRRANLTVTTGAHTTRIVFEGRRAVGVEYEFGGSKKIERAAREVIVAGGAINSPQLLMLSGVGPAAQLRAHGIDVVHDLPGVGQNLQDHLAIAVIVGCKQPVTLVSAEKIRNVLRYLVLRRGMLTSNIAEAAAFVRTDPSLPAPDLELIFAPVPFIDHGLVPQKAHGITVGSILLRPESAGTLTLRSADPHAAPNLDPAYLSDHDGRDLRTLTHGVRLAQRILRTRELQPYVGAPIEPERSLESDADIAAFIREQAETLYHPVGTCRMGNDALAVVDSQLRVRGVEGLRVADASVMPTLIRGHTNAPAIMIGEKAADLIRHA